MPDTTQLTNNSSSVIEGDKMTLSCKRRHNPVTETPEVQVAVYRNERRVQEFGPSATYTVPSAQLEDSGNYSCVVRNSTGSVRKTRAVSVQIEALFNTPQIRNNQSSVTEGDEMTLTCDTRRNPARSTMELLFAFYRDGQNVQRFSTSAIYSVLSAQLMLSGNYTCDVRTPSDHVKKRSNVLSIPIEALFGTPQIRTNQSSVTEGDEMTLTCDTTRNLATATMELAFAFYRDGWNEQVFSASDTYSVPSAQLVHSGKYTCEVRTPSDVWKRSDALYIHVQALFGTPQMRSNPSPVTEGDELTLTCRVTHCPGAGAQKFAFRRDLLNREDYNGYDEYGDPLPQLLDSGDVTCDEGAPSGHVRNTLNITGLEFAFYRDWQNVQEFSVSDTFSVLSAQLEDSDYYTCEVRTPSGRVRKRSDWLYVHVQDLFDTPVIRNNQAPVTEGDEMTLTCVARRNLVTATTELEFSFYMYEQTVQEFSASDTYSVPSAQLEHSGDYTCDVRTPSGSVIKTSKALYIEIKALSVFLESASLYDISEGDAMILICETNLPVAATRRPEFAFYRNGEYEAQFSDSNIYVLLQAQMWHSGDYTCEAGTPSGRVRKRSNVLSIQIEGIFSAPQIRTRRPSVTEGDNMTLTCDTRRYCVRFDVELEFAFYMNWETVQNFSASDTYSFLSAQSVHAGNYTCDVRDLSHGVRKGSNVFYVHIEEKGPPLPILLGAIYGSLAVIALICVLLAWKSRTKRAARNTTAASSSKNENSPATYAAVEPTET